MKKRYICFSFSNGYCGCDIQEFIAFPSDYSDKNVSDYGNDMLSDYADEYKPFLDDEDEVDYYYENYSFDWEEVSKEEWEENGGYDY